MPFKNLASTTYEVQTFTFYTCSKGWGGGQDSPHPPLSPIDTEFRHLCELGIFGINEIFSF